MECEYESGQSVRSRIRCEPPRWRLIVQPIRSRADKTSRAFVDGHWLMASPRRARPSPERLAMFEAVGQDRGGKTFALVIASISVWPSTSTPGSSRTSAIHRPSSSRSSMTVRHIRSASSEVRSIKSAIIDLTMIAVCSETLSGSTRLAIAGRWNYARSDRLETRTAIELPSRCQLLEEDERRRARPRSGDPSRESRSWTGMRRRSYRCARGTGWRSAATAR